MTARKRCSSTWKGGTTGDHCRCKLPSCTLTTPSPRTISRQLLGWTNCSMEKTLLGYLGSRYGRFVRISTNPKAWSFPIPVHAVFGLIRDWLAQPGDVIVHPGPRHAELLERLVTECRAAGPLVSDAVLAALAIENGAVLASTDRDFSRFPDLRWVNPVP